MKQTVTILGAGSWGTALGLVLADNGHQVRMWGHNPEDIKAINQDHVNKRYLPEVVLPTTIQGFDDLKEALEGVDTIVFAVPTKAIREVAQKVVSLATHPLTVIHVSKGIEPDSLRRISEMLEEEMAETAKDIIVLSGPSHAEEVGLRIPTTVTVASKNMEAARGVQDLFMNGNFRVYTNQDLLGVEIGGALKNIIALAAGITDGLGYGDNAKAALMTRGLAEITRLGVKMGADPLTFLGLTGIGDLIVTCTSVHSRNWRAGNMLGQGKNLDEVLDSMGMVVEGVRTTKAAYQLSEKYQVKMPITKALYDVLFNGKNIKEEVDGLMTRGKKHENEELIDIIVKNNE